MSRQNRTACWLRKLYAIWNSGKLWAKPLWLHLHSVKLDAATRRRLRQQLRD
jgi:hypothetical protein